MEEVQYDFRSHLDIELIDKLGGDQDVVAAARTSTRSESRQPVAEDEAAGLIRYLMKHRHGTPFEHGTLRFFCRAPIFVWREWHRHRIASYNEESGRYKTLEPVFYIPDRERPMLKVGEGWKPSRPKFVRLEDDGVYADLVRDLQDSYRQSYQAYLRNLARDVDPGLARACLPVGIYSSCWVTVNPRSLMHFLSLRTHEPEATFVSHPLYEIEVAARLCEAVFAQGWPLTYRAFVDCGRVSP